MIEAIQSTSFRNGSSRGVSRKRRDESTTLVGHRFDSPLEAGASTASETAAEPSIQAHVGRIHQRPALYAANERRAYQTMVRENAKFHLIHSFNGNLATGVRHTEGKEHYHRTHHSSYVRVR